MKISWRETSLYLCTASLYLCTVSLYLEKVVASKQLKFAMEMDVERKARLEKMVAATQLRLALETEEERRAKKMNEFNLDFITKTFFTRARKRAGLLGERSEPHTGVFNRDFAWYIYIYKTYYTGQPVIWRDISRVATVLSRAEGEWKYKVRVKCLHISQRPSVINCLLHTVLAQLNAYQVFQWVFQPFQPFQWR